MRSLSFWRVLRTLCTFCGVTQLRSSSLDIDVETSETRLRLSSGLTASFRSTGSFRLSGKWCCILLNASISIVLKAELFVTVMGGAFSHSACLISLYFKLKEKNEKRNHRLENFEYKNSLAFSCWCKHYFCLTLEIIMLLMLGFITKKLIQICGFSRFTVKTFSRNRLSMYTIKTHHFNGGRRRHWRALQPIQAILDPVQPLANPSVHWLDDWFNFVDHLKSSKR